MDNLPEENEKSNEEPTEFSRCMCRGLSHARFLFCKKAVRG